MPPPVLVILAIAAVQVGASIATQLFPVLGAEGTVAARVIFSSLLLLLAAGKGVRRFALVFAKHWRMLMLFGICVAAMNLFFYQALARIPLGVAVAFEFIGPLGVAAFTSRLPRQFVWIAVAAVGIALLSPLSGTDLDPLGVMFALLAGVGWGLFILVARAVGQSVSGNDGLTIGMAIAGIVMLPFFVPIVGALIADPHIALAALGVALLSTTIPFTLEFEALKRLSARAYGVLVSLEPAMAVLVGALLLDERIGVQGLFGVACVVVAAIGVTISDQREPRSL